MTPAIAILGAGPSGLALARLLEVKKFDYTVFERNESPSNEGQGGSLDIHTNSGQLALKECGLLAEFESLARYDGQAFTMTDKTGKISWKRPYNGQTDRPEIDRRVLRQMLLKSIPDERVRWGCRVESVFRDADGSMAIRFSDGGVEKGLKLVVGADGTWSKARNLITVAKPQYSGYTFLQTNISKCNPIYPQVCARVGKGSYHALGARKSILSMRQGDDTYMAYIGLQIPENWAKDQESYFRSPHFREQIIEDEFADWNPEITELISRSDGEWYAWPLYAMPPEALTWESVPGVTLIGDAAHVSTPFQGEGVNLAMYDSFRLAERIAECGLENLDEAVRRYEKEMLPRGIDLITRSEANGKLFFADDAPQGFLDMIRSKGMKIETE